MAFYLRKLKAFLTPQSIIITVVILIIGALVLVPFVFLMYGSFFTPAFKGQPPQFTFNNYIKAYTDSGSYGLLRNSLYFAIGHTMLAVLLGTFLAWVTERTNTPGKNLVSLLAMVPLIIPSMLEAIAWIFLLSPKIGLINLAITALFHIEKSPLNIYSYAGMMWVSGLHWSPFVFLMMAAAFRSMDPSLEEASLMAGVSRWITFRKITLKLALPATSAAVLIMFVRGLELFETPALIGLPAGIQVFTTKIFLAVRRYPSELGLAASYSTILMIVTTLLIYQYNRMLRHTGRYATITGKAYRGRVMDLGPWRYATAAVIVLYFFIVIGLPLSVLIWNSLLRYYQAPSMQALGTVSLRNYIFLFKDQTVLHALKNSVMLSTGCATMVMLLTAVAAWFIQKTRVKGRWLLDIFISLPMTFPGLIMGVSLIWAYSVIPLPIYGTIWILLIAYSTRYLPYGMRNAAAAMAQITSELEEASQTSGVSWWITFSRIILPLLKPGLLAGWLYVVMVSIKELSSSLLLYSHGSEVVSIIIWEYWENGLFNEVSALGVLLLMGLMILSVIADRIAARYGIKH
ncbi:MAG: iron ABC transporter permease [Desulfobacterales bacterium]|nr:iron ABC transporter permease [Desulfobacterales bacterium]